MIHLKSYKNELIIGFAVLLFIIAFSYKNIKVSNQNSASSSIASSLQELKEVIELQKIWGDKKITKKIEKLKNLIPSSKTKWQRKGKKLSASFSDINAAQLNKLVTKIMNLAVEIEKLDVQKTASSYNVEFKCKW